MDAYRYNGRFIGMNRPSRLTLADGELRCANWDLNTSGHKVYFGPYFHHSGVVYGKTKHNSELMLRRLFQSRDHEELLRQQQLHVQLLDGFDAWLSAMQARALICGEGLDEPFEEQLKFCLKPHPKQKLRIRALRELYDEGNVRSYRDFMRRGSVTLKIKYPEFAKPGKAPRVIGDYSVHGSIVAGYLLEPMKKIFLETVQIGRFKVCFVGRPRLEVLDEVFENLINGGDVAYYFSDDMSIAFTFQGKRFMCNADISKCDASNGGKIFEIAQSILAVPGHRETAAAAVQQCCAVAKLYHPITHKSILSVKGVEPIQYSGSVLTTFNNNIASQLIIMGISQVLEDCENFDDIPAYVALGASLAGYEVTCETCDHPSKLQFLKHSPARDIHGVWRAVLNPGVVLRSMGQCDDRVPGKEKVPLEQRCLRFLSGLIRGYRFAGNHSLMRSLRERFPLKVSPVFHSYITEEVYANSKDSSRSGGALREDVVLDDSDILRRYDITIQEWEELVDSIRHGELGYQIKCRASDLILRKDYGL